MQTTSMHRYTPRTCLWPLTAALIFTFCLSLGLTFRSSHACYAGVCGEWLFALQARLHVVVWYSWLSLSVTILALRAFQPSVKKIMQKPIMHRNLPLLGKKLQISGVCIVLWIVLLYAIVTMIWWRRLDSYFETRGQANGDLKGNHLLAAIALTGHYGDITMGMALLPVSRHSALASFFKLSVSSTLSLHMLTAYTLFVIVLVHGLLYAAWLGTRSTLNPQIIQQYPILEPTYLADEVYPGNTSSLGIWRASLIFTGTAAAFIMILILFTTLPKVRLRHFNLFYFTHLSTILLVIIVCLHASTMFYCTAPGLMMIVLDWGMRLHDLRRELDAQIVHLGKGWYSLSVSLPRLRLKGCSCNSPLAHFYIQHGASSVRELHPFTTTTYLAGQDELIPSQADSVSVQFLFRKARHPAADSRSGSITIETIQDADQRFRKTRWTAMLSKCGFRQTKWVPEKMQWVEKLAAITERTSSSTNPINAQNLVHINTKVRLEGPYFTPAIPHAYNTVLCIVAGTGLSGALAIAAAFTARHESEHARQDAQGINHAETPTDKPKNHPQSWTRLLICWSVRAEDYLELPFAALHHTPGLEIRPCLTGPGRPRMNITETIRELKATQNTHTSVVAVASGASNAPPPQQKIWAYISGPGGFIAAAEAVCKTEKIDYYGARWDI